MTRTLALAAVIAASLVFPATALADAEWRLNETSRTQASDSVGSNHGTYNGGYTLNQPGSTSNDAAVDLNGTTGYVDLPNVLNPSGAFSIEATVKLDATGGLQTIVSQRDGSGTGRTLLFVRDTSDGSTFASNLGGTIRDSGVSAVAGTWYHVVFTYAGGANGAWSFYVDGELAASGTATGESAIGGWRLGSNKLLGAGTFWNGKLDDVAVYNRALGSSEVTPPIGCAPAFGSFGVDSWPPACWRPYADTSPFNRQLPTTLTASQIDPNSTNVVNRVTGWGLPSKLAANYQGTSEDWAHPTYYSTSTDPLFRPDCTEPWGTCTRSDGVNLETLQIRIPDAARAATGGDHHMTVVDQASGWEYDFWGVTSKPAGGGTLQLQWGGATRIDGDGRASDATAARYGNLAGIIRAQELEAGAINHALFMVIRCDSGSFVYPAMKGGRACSDIGESNTNAPPMGARFQLNMTDAEIAAMSVPAWKKTIFRAMARYGMYFGDTGGGSNWGVQVESDQTYTSFGRTGKFLAFAQANGWTPYNDTSVGRTVYVGDLQNDIDWRTKLRVVAPCVGAGTC